MAACSRWAASKNSDDTTHARCCCVMWADLWWRARVFLADSQHTTQTRHSATVASSLISRGDGPARSQSCWPQTSARSFFTQVIAINTNAAASFNRTMKATTQIATLAVAAIATGCSAFAPTASVISAQSSSSQLYAKGFGTPPPEPRQKSEGQIDREAKASKYDEIAATGGQEYRIFVRQFGSDDKSWLPVGSIAVPRNAQVSDAVFANEEGLRTSITRVYPKLKG